MEKSQLVLQEFASQLPPDTPLKSVDPSPDAGFQILTQTFDQTLGRRPGTYCRGMENAWRRKLGAPSSSQSNSQVIALTTKVAEFKTQLSSYITQITSYSTQMSQLLESLVWSGFLVPNFGPSSTSEPLQPEHGHHTSAPIDHGQTSELPLADDQVDFGISFD